ncbi:hypothetical protein ACFXGI_10285 [Streptomyces sp. NPDC059355]|uniref:hypothetical protein n=1 Tax=Streptomyces sp. NPDC059355 TaxID=3346811 RepID=UPI003682BE0E
MFDEQPGYDLERAIERERVLERTPGSFRMAHSVSTDGAGLVPLLLSPIGIAILVLQGLAAGVDRLTYDSPLAFLFPVPGDGPVRFALSLITLVLFVPGTLLWTSRRLRTTRLRPLCTWLLSPAAVLLVPVVVYVAVTTYTTDVVRLGG